MVSDKSLYWMAVGILVLGVGNSLISRQNDVVSCLSERSLNVVQSVANRAMSMIGQGGLLFDRTNDSFARSQLAVARVQTRLASVQARIAVRQATFARLEAQKAKGVAFSTMKQTIKCPQEEVPVEIPDIEVDGSVDVK